MKLRTPNFAKSPIFAVTAICALAVLSFAAPQAKQRSLPAAQKTFDTPELAAQALLQAVETYNVPALLEILGPDAQDIVTSEDPVADKNRANDFVKLAREKTAIKVDSKKPTRAEFLVGDDDWPLPIPLVKRSGRWYFDTPAGRQEILLRRIGQNELDAIKICRGFVEAQHEYAFEAHDGASSHEYAQRIVSTPGKQDGLAWQTPDGSWGGPVGEEIAKAIQQGYTAQGQPYHGYYFKVLKGQGPAAPMGQMDFVVKGAMIGGFALAAAPAQYRVTGVKTFIVSHDGVVYEKDMGPNTLTAFKDMERFNPDKTWRPTSDEQ